MPYYEFECKNCSNVFEEFQTIANIDVPLKSVCSSCNESGHIERLISGADICDPVSLGVKKVPKAFNDLLHGMNRKVPGAKIKVIE